MRYFGILIRLGVLSVAAFTSMTACGADSSSDTGPNGTGGASDGGGGSSGTAGSSGGGGAVGDAGSDAPTGCSNGEQQACYTGPPSTQGIGECKDGTTTCQNGIWGACTGDVMPGTETCDTKDNNCNGTVDEGCACTDGEKRACYSGPSNTANTGICKDGIQTCEGGTWGNTCAGEVTPTSESCNGADDNCDGLVDDGNPEGGSPCSTGLQGICAAGTEMCQGGALKCVQNESSKAETCNGEDDDCNGSTDEGDPGGGASCSTGLPGVCSAGTKHCQNGTVDCVQNVPSGAETCNGKDDNCNGSVDENNPGGGGSCNTGIPGICAPGTNQCLGGTVQCVQNQQPKAETCNGQDDNCSGAVDEGNPGGGGACTVVGKKGECAKSNWTCTGGTLQCLQKINPTTEVCDGKDNDCDGLTDEWPACCPYILSDDGSGFRYESTVGGVALVGKSQHLDPAHAGKRIDFMPMWVRLEHARVESGRLRTKLLAAEDEIVYLDEAHLTVVEHPQGHEVFTATSISRRPDEPQAGEDFTALPSASLRAPERALFMGETDVTTEISQLNERAVRHDLRADNFYELDFGPTQAPRQAHLVVDGWRLRLERQLPPELVGRKPCLEVEQADGSFQKVMELGAPRGDKKALCFDLSGIEWPSGRYRMRLFLGTAQAGMGMWFVDRVRLSEAKPAAIHRYEVCATRAELSFCGAPTLAAGGDPTRPRLAIDDGRGELGPEHRTFGRFTRYGEVTELVGEANDMFVIMRRGDGVVIEFDGVRDAPEGRERTLFLHSDLVFKPHTLPGLGATAKTEWVGPLPFHGMARYGSGGFGAYPQTEAHRRYQAQMLTREYLPSDRHFGPHDARLLPFARPKRQARRRRAA